MEYKIEIPRTTYDGMCGFLQRWSDIYSVDGVVILRGSLRNPYGTEASTLFTPATPNGDAKALALTYTTALHALGRAKVMKASVLFDLRDLEDDEVVALEFCSSVAMLRAPQTRVLERLARSTRAFNALPAMVRLAIAASD
jgi:hypothetical protein